MNKTMNVAPVFTDEQKNAILRTAGRKVALTVCRIEDKIQKEELADAGETPVYGVFVSLKRFMQLRACCGSLGDSVTLCDALNQAAYRAAIDDIRFTPIENFELNEMEMEVWILHSPELLGAKGNERQNFVEIGKHGLLVVQGERRGMLLPSVAKEMKLNPVTFLEQTCRKAGLAKDAWKDENTMIFRFQGICYESNIQKLLPKEIASQILVPTPGPSRSDLAKLADHCYRNIIRQFNRQVPDYYLPGAYDGTISGACLRVRLNNMSADCAQIYLNNPQPLQATLNNLSQNASMTMRQNNLSPAQLQKTALCVFWDAVNIGNAENADVSALDTRHFGILAIRFGRWILGFAPRKKPEAILEDVLKNSGFDKDESTQIFTVRAACTDVAFMTSTVQKPIVRDTPRPMIAAGLFYPAKAEEMEDMRKSCFPAEMPEKKTYAGALVPHAGWKYSGKLLAKTLGTMNFANRILIFAPKHNAQGVDWAVCPTPRWNLPGRPMEGEPNMGRALCKAVPRFQLDSYAHDREHSIEVILPFLATLTPSSHIVGALMQGGERHLAESAKQLADWIRTLPQRPTLLASSDLNHYAPQEETIRADEKAIEAILVLDPEKLLETVRENRISMCGCLATAFMMMTLRELGLLNRCTLVGHTTSAENGGSTNSAVGYCGALFE